MPRPKNTETRCSDPIFEPERNRWRVIMRRPEGKRESTFFDKEATAKEFVRTFRNEVELTKTFSVEDALNEYAHYQSLKKLAKAGIDTTQLRLRGFFGALLSAPVAGLTASDMEKAYTAYQVRPDGRPRADATHMGALSQGKTFLKWCMKKKWCKSNPAEAVEPLGKRKKGKPQLRITEAQLFAQTAALSYLQEGDERGLAVLMALCLGTRRKELVQRHVRDVDAGATILWITRETTKTDGGERTIDIPVLLQPYLKRHMQGKMGEDFLFAYRSKDWLRRATHYICEKAGLPKVCAQSLRGMHASIALGRGATPHLVAQTLGNSPQIMLAHYARPGALQSGTSDTLLTLLGSSVALGEGGVVH